MTNPELQEIRTHLGIINDIIRSLAVEYDLALVDAELFFLNIDSGFPFNGINMGTGFISGGAYGLDGIRFNARTNALLPTNLLNQLIKNTMRHIQ